MASRRFTRKPPVNLCSEPGAEDGIDPRFLPAHSPGKASNRKALQLCRQVERTLSVALEGDLLRDLSVQSVIPAPDSTRLMVTVVFHGAATVTATEVLDAIHMQSVRLRAEVAAAIHRKKTPQLTFRVVRA
ncbi:MAG: ribosome-binding factor A [Planctomycetes bacterium]|nr:ribosome-binding factor A [Planctomycetota bacterium]